MFRNVSTAFAAALFFAASLTIATLAGTTAGFAQEAKLGDLKIDQSWARASAGPARNSAAFMMIHNGGDADRLVSAAGDVADRVELHTHLMEGNVMKMRQVEAIEVPAKGMAALQPGGFHVMLIGLHEALKEGDSFPLTLTFEKAGAVTIEVPVQAIGSMGPNSMNQGSMNQGGMKHGDMPKSN